ncbi:unnamed protein product [Adineta steineri]|uniref:Uncharacterized protein n=1 Tax=Adineta steineri TaxID=433720 RepID=A0A815N840_9BILA|nr:unnamed protein product [Adineta steineri]CAF1471290.1 unnamed protein product [Adineta steineri]CAF3557699.1 unnamed protein product [Adineta steineri]CAF4137893.1 unnamed protein product [Adineta steineri]
MFICQRYYCGNERTKRENVFISSDEIDVINTRFGVYQVGSIDNDIKTFGSKLLCQGYDIMKNVSRTTGSSKHVIICMSDGTISRYLFITTSVHKTSNDIPSEILSVQPNIVHILIVLRILVQYKPIFVFGEHQFPINLPKLIIFPPDIEEARENILNPIPKTEPISNLKPRVVVGIKETDIEQDGSIISAYNAIRRVIEAEYQKSLQRDVKGRPIYTSLQRVFQQQSSNKLARSAGLCQALSYAIRLCSECINIVRFGDGLYLKEYIDDE